MVSLNPIRIFKGEADEEKGETARMSSFVGAIAIGDLVKTTLGCKGMDKILVSHGRKSGHVEFTNDGATILRSIGVDNPAAKILVNMARVQDEQVGDGTTSVTVFASELLKEAEMLIQTKIHPQTIIAGWRAALEIAKSALEASAIDVSSDQALLQEELRKVTRTTLSSKILHQHIDHFTDLAVKAVLRLNEQSTLSAIQILKIPGGTLQDSFLEPGFLLDKKVGQNQPKRIENANILIANTPMDTDKVKVFGSRVRVDSVAKVAELEFAEKMKMKDKVDKILKHGCNVFINRQLIYNYPEQLFADAGVMAIEHADFDGIERLALVTGGEIVSTFDCPQTTKLGHCELIDELLVGEEKLIRFSGPALGEACSVVIRGATQQIIDEAERSLHDALCVLYSLVKEKKIIYGGGCAEMTMALAVLKAAATTPGKQSLAMESFAKALLQLPSAIADNGGLDSAELLANLKAAHNTGQTTAGLDMIKGGVGCMKQLGITEPLTVKRHMVISGSEAGEMILRVDNILKAAPHRRTEDRGYC